MARAMKKRGLSSNFRYRQRRRKYTADALEPRECAYAHDRPAGQVAVMRAKMDRIMNVDSARRDAASRGFTPYVYATTVSRAITLPDDEILTRKQRDDKGQKASLFRATTPFRHSRGAHTLRRRLPGS